MDAGEEVKLKIANHNKNANDDVCLEDIFLNVASVKASKLNFRVSEHCILHSGVELWFREKKSAWHMTFTRL